MWGYAYVFRIWSTQCYLWAFSVCSFRVIFVLCWDLGQFFIKKEKLMYLQAHAGHASPYLHQKLVTRWHLYIQHSWNSYGFRTNSIHFCRTSVFYLGQGQPFRYYADDLHLLKHTQSVDYYTQIYSVLKCLTNFFTRYL